MVSTRDHSDSVYAPLLPFPISRINSGNTKRYTLYDIELITWLRREHHILGVLIGSLPQAPSQNVFLGIPLELMPEEARLLVEKGLAFVTNERTWQMKLAQTGANKLKTDAYQAEIHRRGLEMAEMLHKAKEVRLEEIMKQLSLDKKIPKKIKAEARSQPEMESTSLFVDEKSSHAEAVESNQETRIQANLQPYAITPATAGSLASKDIIAELPEVNSASYALFKMLHEQGYFISPGLRFGCQYMAYPGDPLRYHSHFLTIAGEWDENIDLMDFIGSGRLATGVKKSFLLGGVEPGDDGKTRAFSIEWAGF